MIKFSPQKDLNKLANNAVQQGWKITFSGSGHLRWTTPNGKGVFFSSATPSCPFAIKKIAADMRRTLASAMPTPQQLEKDMLTHKLKIPENLVPGNKPAPSQPTPKPQPVATPPAAPAKQVIFLQTARKQVRELMQQGKNAEDATTVVLTVFDVIDSFRRPCPREILVKAAQAEWNVRKPNSATTVNERVIPEPLPVAAKVPPAVATVEPVQTKAPKPKVNSSNPKLEETFDHIRAVVALPLDKQKKIEIMIELLEAVM